MWHDYLGFPSGIILHNRNAQVEKLCGVTFRSCRRHPCKSAGCSRSSHADGPPYATCSFSCPCSLSQRLLRVAVVDDCIDILPCECSAGGRFLTLSYRLALYRVILLRHGISHIARAATQTFKIHQRGVRWKKGLVIHVMLYTSLSYNTTPIRCAPL